MKAFLYAYPTNFDLGVTLIYAEGRKVADELAKTSGSVWFEEAYCIEVDPAVSSSRVLRIDMEAAYLRCDTCDGSGEVHSHNPKCWGCCG